MKYKIQLYTLAVATVAFLFSCSEDEGNYDYNELNDVEISGIEDIYVVEQFSNLSITPELKFNLDNEEDNLEHLWYIYTSSQKDSADTISTNRNLNELIETIPEQYTCIYKVTDKETGVYYTHKFMILVTGVLSNGLFVLSEIDGKANVSMINISGKVFEDIYFTLNDEYAGTNPVSLVDITNKHEKGILIMCDDEQGGTICDPDTYYKSGIYADMFWVDEGFPNPVKFIQNQDDEFMIAGNRIHHRNIRQIPPVKFGTSVLDNVNLVPELINGDSFYDNKNEQFISVSYQGSAGPVQNMPDSLFNPANIGMELLIGGDGYKGDFYGLFYDDESMAYRVLISTYTQVYYNKKFIPSKIVDIKSATDIDKANTMALSSLSPQVFYAVDNKLYCLSMETDICKLVHSFDSGTTIDHIELEAMTNDRVMFVGTSSAGEGKTGSVHILDVELNGSVEVLQSYKNIAGKVVDFMNK